MAYKMQGSGPEPQAPHQAGREVATEIVPIPALHLPPSVWRSATEMRAARDFRRRVGLDYETVVSQMIDTAEPQRGVRALDVETGTGVVARQLAICIGGGGHVIGVDESLEMVEQARLGAQSAGLTLRAEWQGAAADSLPFGDDEFDIVTCGTAFHRLPTQRFLEEGHRVLKPGGRLVIADELRSRLGVLWFWLLALRGYDRLFRRAEVNTGEQFYLAEEVAEMLGGVGFSQLVVKGMQPRNRRGRAFSLIKAVK